MGHESDNYTNHDWRFCYSRQILLKVLQDLEIRRRVETIQTTCIIENGKYTEKGTWDLKKLAVTQTDRPSANTDMKKSQEVNNNNNNNNNNNKYVV